MHHSTLRRTSLYRMVATYGDLMRSCCACEGRILNWKGGYDAALNIFLSTIIERFSDRFLHNLRLRPSSERTPAAATDTNATAGATACSNANTCGETYTARHT
ncbi:hypothetical protein AA0488_0965 [Kozakia baliensis NRIC 0488]|nr:hypothetical protein AA0488_0965 [Kozakia baliensis NRIC 0488]GEL64289.1 hypothetical protein KBA01_15750 [Kozakia baliensis]